MTPQSQGTHGPHIALIGLSGVGKTTIGKQLAKTRGWGFVDTDTVVEARLGRTIEEIFSLEGEAGFRSLEEAVVGDVLAASLPTVIATGGGAILSPANRAALAARATVVWLRADLGVVLARLRESSDVRPLVVDDPEAKLGALAKAREPLYRDTSDVVVDVSLHNAKETVEKIEDELAQLAARKGNT